MGHSETKFAEFPKYGRSEGIIGYIAYAWTNVGEEVIVTTSCERCDAIMRY